MPRTYPSVPTNSAGTISACQPLDTAIAAAVVGPPTFAFEEIMISSIENLKIFPNISDTIKFVNTMIAASNRLYLSVNYHYDTFKR